MSINKITAYIFLNKCKLNGLNFKDSINFLANSDLDENCNRATTHRLFKKFWIDQEKKDALEKNRDIFTKNSQEQIISKYDKENDCFLSIDEKVKNYFSREWILANSLSNKNSRKNARNKLRNKFMEINNCSLSGLGV